MPTIFVGTEMDLAEIAEELHTLAECFFRLDQADRNMIIDTIESKLGPARRAEVYSADLFAPFTVKAASSHNGSSSMTTKEAGGPELTPGMAEALELVEKMTRRKGDGTA